MVAKYLGFGRPSVTTRASIRGYVECEGGHGFEPEFLQFFGNGVRFGVTPCDDHGVYWFFSYIPSPQGTCSLVPLETLEWWMPMQSAMNTFLLHIYMFDEILCRYGH